MKKILAMVLSVALIASLAIGGTVAYLTDSDEATNVFAVGNVEIELMEEQRKVTATGTGTETKSTELEEFKQNKNLMPIVTEEVNDDGSGKFAYDTLGMNTAQNYQDKIVRVKNTGSSDAWVRIFVAVPAALEDKVGEEGAQTCALHWDVGDRFDTTRGGQYNSNNTTNPFNEEFGEAVFKGKMTIDGIDGLEYNVYCFTRKTPLKPESITAAAFVGFYLDEKVDNNSDDGYYYIGSKKDKDNRITVKGVGKMKADNSDYEAAYDFSNGVVIPVYAEAVQTSGFATAEEAFSRAIAPDTTEKPYNPWAEDGNATVELPDEVKTVDELVNALNGLKSASGKQTITLSSNKKYDFTGKKSQFYFTNTTAEITIEGNGAIITGLTKPLINSVQSKSITIKDLTISGLNLTDTQNLGGTHIGAFIQYTTYNTTENITFSNCHLVNSTIEAKKQDDHVGGLIGCAYLKNTSSSTVTIEDCSVVNCNLSGNQNVGGLIGWLCNGKTTVSNSKVKNCNLTSNATTSWRIGAIFGTQNDSKTIVEEFTRSGNTLKQDNAKNIFTPEQQKRNNRDLYGIKNGNEALIVDGIAVK